MKKKMEKMEEMLERLQSQTPQIAAAKDDSWTSESATDGEETESDDRGKKK